MIETCAQKFAMRGNPWISERDRDEMQAELSPARGGAHLAYPKPKFRDLPREKREFSQIEAAQIRSRENMLAIRQLMQTHPRTCKPLELPKERPLVSTMRHHEELNPWSPLAIEAERIRLEKRAKQARDEIEQKKANVFSEYAAVMGGAMS